MIHDHGYHVDVEVAGSGESSLVVEDVPPVFGLYIGTGGAVAGR